MSNQTNIMSMQVLISTVVRKLENPPHHGAAYRVLSEQDKHDVAQICASVIAGYRGADKPQAENLFFDGDSLGAYCKPLDKDTWLACFSLCRKELRMDRVYEKPKFQFRLDDPNYQLPDDIQAIENKHYGYNQAKRDTLANQAKLYRRALRAAFHADTRRKRKSIYRNAVSFLKQAVSVINGGGHGMDTTDKTTRSKRKKAMQLYLAEGIQILSNTGKITSFSDLDILLANK